MIIYVIRIGSTSENIDDYTCFVSTYEESQQFLIDLSDNLRDFNLSLNHKKTEILDLPLASGEQWVRKMNTIIRFSKDKFVKYPEIRSFLDLAVELMQQNANNSAIIKYAVKTLADQNLTYNAQEYYVKTIFHLSYIYPYLIPLLDKYVFEPLHVNVIDISSITNKLFDRSILERNYEGSIYCIYFAIKYKFNIVKLQFTDIEKSNSCLLMLMGFLYCKNKNMTRELKEYKKLARSLKSNNFDGYWIFIYEALPKSDLNSLWAKMKSSNISFVVPEYR